MINYSALETIRKKYTTKQIPFLTQLLQKAQQDKIYQGLNILHNTALTVEAVLKVEPLIVGGANVTMSCITLLPPQEEAIAILKAANVNLILDHQFDVEYDIHLDCCGELLKARAPKIGSVELTQTGSELYKQADLTYPVISVDDSKVKLLETFFGTGEGFVQALYATQATAMYNQSYVVFGFGKVGKGIVHALKKITDKIIAVIDVYVAEFDKNHYSDVEFINACDREQISQALRNAYCVVTATGIEGVMSKYYAFTKADFGQAVLTNMGADDEYGKNFHQSDVLFEKRPLNFSIAEPTPMKYLDPVFYAHNLGVDILLSRKMQPGYHPFPNDLSEHILKNWQDIHQEAISIFD